MVPCLIQFGIDNRDLSTRLMRRLHIPNSFHALIACLISCLSSDTCLYGNIDGGTIRCTGMQLADWDAGVPKGPVFSLDFAPNITLEDRHIRVTLLRGQGKVKATGSRWARWGAMVATGPWQGYRQSVDGLPWKGAPCPNTFSWCPGLFSNGPRQSPAAGLEFPSCQ